ncbi:hypothetical protein [Candidatus Avelusimicrobium sp.]|uniref:hypothetical protein n=1 Tax=Candidatus Avelusimicrobium sp. TaxID=3048833 RepID=UPI003D7E01FA
MKRNLFLLPILASLLFALPLQAQEVVQVGKGAVKVTDTATKAAEAGAKASARAAAAGTAVSFSARLAQQFPGVVVKAYELKGLSRPQALRKAVELGANKAQPAWPKLQADGAIHTQTFKDLTLDGYKGVVPALPHPNRKMYLHRGMGLTEEGLVKVLQKGVLLEDAGGASDWLNTSLAMGSIGTPGMSQSLLDKMSEAKAINFTINAQEAAHYAQNNSFKDGKVPVVVTTHGMRDKDPLSGYYTFKEDIKPEQFTAVAVLLKGPTGLPIWYRANLAKDGKTLVLTPYQVAEK